MGRGRGVAIQETIEECRDTISDRIQYNLGLNESKVVLMDIVTGPNQNVSLQERTKRWMAVSVDARMTKFKKVIYFYV